MAYDHQSDYQAPVRRYYDQGSQNPAPHSQRPPSNQQQQYDDNFGGYNQGQNGYGYEQYGHEQEYAYQNHGQQSFGDSHQYHGQNQRPPPRRNQTDDFGYGDLVEAYEDPPPQSRGPRRPSPGGPVRGGPGRGGPPRGGYPPRNQSHGYDEGHRGQENGYGQQARPNGSQRPPSAPRQNSGGRGQPLAQGNYARQQQHPSQRGPPPQQRPGSRDQQSEGQSRQMRPQPGARQNTRERIPQPQAPLVLSQDNAFPSFGNNSSKPVTDTTGVEEGLDRMNINPGRKSEDRVRPPTSSSHRSKASHGSSRPQKPNGFHDSGYQESFEPPFASQRPGYASKDSFNSVPSMDDSMQARISQRRSPPRLPPLRLGQGHEQGDRLSNDHPRSALSPSKQSFGPPMRAVTMPNNPGLAGPNNSQVQEQWVQLPPRDSKGPTLPSFPPPRPSTASGHGQYQSQAVEQGGQVYKAFTSPKYEEDNPVEQLHKRDESLSDLYDDYYGSDDPQKHGRMSSREAAIENDMPNFDAIPAAQSPRFTLHFNSPTLNGTPSPDPLDAPEVYNAHAGNSAGFYKQAKMSRSQPDLRSSARGSPHNYDTQHNVPPMPRNNMTPGPGPEPRGYGPPADGPRGYGQRTGSGMQPPNQNYDSNSSGFRPSLDSQRPSLQPDQARYSSPDALPAHPVPVRQGLREQTASPMNGGQGYSSRPPPVRQYNSDPAAAQTASEAPGRSSMDRRSSILVTHDELNRLRSIVRTQPNDRKSQLLLAKKLVEAARVLADEGGKADMKTRNKNREKLISEAYKNVKKLVSLAYPEAFFYLADAYGQGSLGLEVDPKEAFNLYQQAAKMGHPQSAYRTAVCCEMGAEDGGGTRRDPLKAVQWYKRAATLGDTAAMYKAGMISLKGLLGQPKNLGEAINWLKRAADRADEENPHALHELAIMYESAAPNSNGAILRDENHAFQLFKQAADLGYKFSQFRLGQAYEYGSLNLQIDARNSIAWYTRAAAQGEHQSELALSGWYLTGAPGILEQSDTEAYLWARKASTASLPKAMFAMGYFTEVGIGCPRSLEEAKKWYGRAAAYKFPKAQERLEELKKGGMKSQRNRERISRGNQKQQDENCVVM